MNGYSTYKALLDRFVSLVQQVFGEQVISIVLYGSVARGDAQPESDIDMLLVLDNIPVNYHKRLEPLLPVLRLIKKEVCWKALEKRGIFPSFSVLILSREEANQNRYLYLDMLTDAKILIDRDNFFQNRLQKLNARLKELGAQKIQRNGGWYWDLKPDLTPGEAVVL